MVDLRKPLIKGCGFQLYAERQMSSVARKVNSALDFSINFVFVYLAAWSQTCTVKLD